MAEFNKLYNPYKELGDNQLRYPLSEPNYKGHIRFTVLNEENSNRKAFDQLTEKLGNSAATLFGRNRDGEQDIGGNLQTITSGDVATNRRDIKQMQGQQASQQTRRSASRFSPSNRTCLLYLPVGLQYRDNASYSNFDLGVTGAALSAGGGVTSGLSTIKDALTNTSADRDVATAAAVGIIDKFGGSMAAVGSAAFKLGVGVTINPNTRTLFEKVGIREFSFTFKFFAESRKEAVEIEKIIQFFREELYPEEINANVSGGETTQSISIGYRFPKKFGIQIEYDGNQIGTKILPCHLRDISTNYNPTNMSFHDDGKFTEIDMTLSFVEIRTLSKTDIKEGF
jgi:hypothetical protein